MDIRDTLRAALAAGDAFGRIGYVYGYPHKKAYRPLDPPRRPGDVWRSEDRRRLFCYVHLPFCTVRCSFCNLFTHVPTNDPTDAYLDTLARQMDYYDDLLSPLRMQALYIGGGTPTFLTAAQLRRLVRHLGEALGVVPSRLASCIEASPETLDEEKIGTLRELGFRRISLGVQSFVADELRHVNRRFDFAHNLRAVEQLGRAGFAQFNIDLIYGLPGQTEASWRRSLDAAVASRATSLYLYPLYVRPLTGLDRRSDLPPAPTPLQMERLYDVALDRLASAGFCQKSMRQFLREETEEKNLSGGTGRERETAAVRAPVSRSRPVPHEFDLHTYFCQRDAMLGLGAGARSYTRELHYSTPWKLVAANIRGVIADYEQSWRAGDALIRHGFVLDEDEQRRRFVILSLLEGSLDCAAFRECYSADPLSLFAPEWDALLAEDCVAIADDAVRLTSRGVRHSDVVGHLFFSERVRQLMETFEPDR